MHSLRFTNNLLSQTYLKRSEKHSRRSYRSFRISPKACCRLVVTVVIPLWTNQFAKSQTHFLTPLNLFWNSSLNNKSFQKIYLRIMSMQSETSKQKLNAQKALPKCDSVFDLCFTDNRTVRPWSNTYFSGFGSHFTAARPSDCHLRSTVRAVQAYERALGGAHSPAPKHRRFH